MSRSKSVTINDDMMKTKLKKVASNNIKWLAMWQAYMDYMDRNKRRPSKYYNEDKALYNWCKHSRKLMNSGKMPHERVHLFRILMDATTKFRRLNQYSYAVGVDGEQGNIVLGAEEAEARKQILRKPNRGHHLYDDNLNAVELTLFPDEE